MSKNNTSVLATATLDIKNTQSEINKQLKKLKIDDIGLTVRLDDLQRLINDAVKAHRPTVKAALDIDRTALEQLKQEPWAVTLELDNAKLGDRTQGWLRENAEAAGAFAGQIKALRAQLAAVDTQAVAGGQLEKAQAKKLSFSGSAALAEVLKGFSFGGTLLAAIQDFKQMADVVRDIDGAMTQLKKATDETSAKYQQFLSSAAVRAKSLGMSIAEVITASAGFARLGLVA